MILRLLREERVVAGLANRLRTAGFVVSRRAHRDRGYLPGLRIDE